MDLDDARRLGDRLLHQHGLNGWRLQFDRARTRAGRCDARHRIISLSAPLTALHDEAEVRETILHEIAHALVGPAHGHDEVWRARALAIGSSGERCVDTDAPRVEGAWKGVCSRGHVVDRHRRPTRVATCRRCSSRFDLRALLTWTHHGRTVPMHPNYVAELEGLRRGVLPRRLRVGQRARLPEVRAAGRWAGSQVIVTKVNRTRYELRLEDGSRVTVPFAMLDGQGAEPPP